MNALNGRGQNPQKDVMDDRPLKDKIQALRTSLIGKQFTKAKQEEIDWTKNA